MGDSYILSGGTLVLPDRLLEKGLLVAREGSIVFAGAQNLSDYLIEGPFVNPKKRGGINPGQIAAPDADLCKKIIDTARGMLKIMTAAPELPDGGRAAAFGTGAASDVFIWNKELSLCRCPADAVVSDELPPGCPDGRPNAQSSFFFERKGT